MKGNVGFTDYTPIHAEEIVIANFPKNTNRVLDFACGKAHFTRQLVKLAQKVYACDVDQALINKNKLHPDGIDFSLIKIGKKTSYKDNFFDCITLMGVLEHVPNEQETLLEMNRILKPGGNLFIYVHNKGLLRFLDAANLKHVAPKLHKLLYFLFYGKKAYQAEFEDKIKQGLIGDTTASRKWHTHYSLPELKNLTSKYFLVEKVWYHSFFFPLLLMSEFCYISIFKKRSRLISWIIRQDNKLNLGTYSYSIVIKCRKK